MFRRAKHWVWLFLCWFVLAGQVWAMPCDVDNDGDIDLDDLNLIQASILARAKVTGASDPRDPDRNGVINSIDGRLCALRCTRAKCSTANQAPFANAGPDQSVKVGDIVRLTGAASSDPDGDPLRYTWTFNTRPSGSIASLLEATTVAPRFTADKPGSYLIQLIVSDGKVDSLPDTLSVSTENSRPIANAGPDQSVRVGTLVTLNGGRSTDVDGDTLTYTWRLSSLPAGSGATLSHPDSVNPTLLIDLPGSYLIALTVSDGKLPSLPDTVAVTTENSPPVANAGPDQSISLGAVITLDGSRSSDVDGNPLTFRWSLLARPPGSAAVLSDPNSVHPSFPADLPGTYVAQLIVNDGSVDSAAASVTLTTANTAPTANAGPDQSVPLGSLVTLDGSASRDPEGAGLTYTWSLIGKPPGSSASLTASNTANPSFTADRPGNYIAQLIVSDGALASSPDTVTLSTANSRPVADAGRSQSVTAGTPVSLDGSASRDADGEPLTYAWSLTTLPSGSRAVLSGGDLVNPGFVPDLPGTYIAQLIVSDGKLDSLPVTVVITVTAANRKPIAVAEAIPTKTTVGSPVVLKGTGSSDPDGDPLTCFWSIALRPGGSSAGIASPAAPETSFVPDVPGIYTIQLVVRDGKVDSVPALVVVEALVANHPPVITSTAVTSATAGQVYAYPVAAMDPDVGDVLAYSLSSAPSGMTINGGTGLIQWTPGVGQVGNQNVEVKVQDTGGLFVLQAFTIVVKTSGIAVPNVVGQTRDAAAAAIGAAGLGLGGSTVQSSATVPAGRVVSQSPAAGTNVSAGALVRLVVSSGPADPLPGIPPDPATVAPPVDSSVASSMAAATSFLYSGASPIQTGVVPGTIEARRVTVIRGRVLDSGGNSLPGVKITVLSHPEFGQTLSRADGMFDLAANGGGVLTLSYEKLNFMPAQRQVNSPWRDFVIAPDVVMMAYDSKVSTINLGAALPMQVASGNPVTDRDGTRTATILFPTGTAAMMVRGDGLTQPLETLNVRATEYTVGANGPKQMPAPLPPASGYTYATELSVDEAVAAGANTVTFSQPLPFYVENFLNFPVGMAVPAGYYDRVRGVWVPSQNGRVIKMLGISSGRADLAVTSSGAPATALELAALGITDAERTQLASLYTAGQSLWRVPISHFTPWDLNWAMGPPPGAKPPGQPPPVPRDDHHAKRADNKCGSIIECQNQVLRERVAVGGTPYSLNYRSDRVPGYTGGTMEIPLSGTDLPLGVKRIELSVSIAGREFKQSFAPVADQKHSFAWDGKDAYGRVLKGKQPATVSIGYVYDPVYQAPAAGARSFGLLSGVPITGNPARGEFSLDQRSTLSLGPVDLRPEGLGGWTLDLHHRYDPVGQIIFLGDGGRREGKSTGSTIKTVAGTGAYGFSGDGGPATSALLAQPSGVAADAAGNLFIADRLNHRIRKVDLSGTITTVVGSTYGFSGDGGPATSAQLSYPSGVAVDAVGNLYIADNGNARIRKVDSLGTISTVAGGGSGPGYPSWGDGDPATSVAVGSLNESTSFWGVAVDGAGNLYFTDYRRLSGC